MCKWRKQVSEGAQCSLGTQLFLSLEQEGKALDPLQSQALLQT